MSYSKTLPFFIDELGKSKLDNDNRQRRLYPCIDIDSNRIIFPEHRCVTLRLRPSQVQTLFLGQLLYLQITTSGCGTETSHFEFNEEVPDNTVLVILMVRLRLVMGGTSAAEGSLLALVTLVFNLVRAFPHSNSQSYSEIKENLFI